MTVFNAFSQDHKKDCLTDEDLFLYISRGGDSEKLGRIEEHCAGCPECRRALAEVLGLLQPDSDRPAEEIPTPDDRELEKTIDLIHDVAGKERSSIKHTFRRLHLPVAAALILGLASLAFWGLKDYSERNKSERYYLQAKTKLEQFYSDRSPHNLRLDTPFDSASTIRHTENTDLMRESERLFYQALAIRENMVEARLGIGYINLKESKFKLAADAFQEALDYRKGDVRALVGRGVARYEEALHSDDPVRYRSLLNGALEDFNEALENDPDSSEALFNKVWVLFESGLHEEALVEIEQYLSRDKESVWAEELKRLRIRIRANSAAYVEKEVERAARTRDPSILKEIARDAPHQMPAAIWTAMRKSLALEKAEEVGRNPNAEDLKWAAEIMESAYRSAVGDHSFGKMIEFYKDLSPSQRLQKKTLDENFQALAKFQEDHKCKTILHRSSPLEQEYLNLQDFWQLYNLHHLRANCFYMTADFNNAFEEQSEMLRIARRLDSPDLIARSLAALALIKGEQRKYDDSIRFAGELREIIGRHNLDSWRSYAGVKFGYQYLRLGQYDWSLKESTAALRWANRFSDIGNIAEALENIGTVMDRRGRLREAELFYDAAFRRLESHPAEKPDKGASQLELRRWNLIYKQGEFYLRAGNLDEAVSHFQNCLESIPSDMHELIARNRIGLVEAFLKQRRNSEAGAMLKRVTAASLEQYPEMEWKARLFQGRMQEDEGDFNGALASYQKAVGVVEGIRNDIESTSLRHYFLSERFDPYKGIIGLLYRHEGGKQRSLEYVDRAKSMTLKEYLSLPDPIPGSNRNSNSVEDYEVPFRILEYFFSQDGLLAFVTGPEGRIIEAVSMDLSRETVAGQVGEILKSVRENDTESFDRLSRRMYGELVVPLERSLLNGREGPVVILPDGPLHLLPFAGLQDDRGRFLIEKNPVVYAPSRSVFRHCLARARSMPAGSEQDVVLIDGTANLPDAKEELVHLADLYKDNVKVLGIHDLHEFGTAVSGSGILHFSGHSVSKEGMPVLMLQQVPREAYLDSREIGTWKLPQCRLVNLAGCSTGIGPISEGESPWGLVPAFLNAGTPTIVASLMPVEDTSTKILTRRFYELLHAGADKATALQKAQTALINQPPDEGKSLSWIPYILIGDPL